LATTATLKTSASISISSCITQLAVDDLFMFSAEFVNPHYPSASSYMSNLPVASGFFSADSSTHSLLALIANSPNAVAVSVGYPLVRFIKVFFFLFLRLYLFAYRILQEQLFSKPQLYFQLLLIFMEELMVLLHSLSMVILKIF
jgi:hypothetical protein